MSWNKRLALCSLLVLVLVVVAFPLSADADRRVISDADDAHGRLDIKSAVAGHLMKSGDGARLIRHRLTTYRRWHKRVLEGGSSHMEFLFDADEDASDDLQVTVDIRNGKLSARITDLDDEKGLGRARVWRPSGRSVSIALRKGDLGGKTYRWHAFTSYHRDDSRRCGTTSDVVVVCSDRVPNHGAALHRTR
jgi:hypothetical protein